jgi:hypothetical protein
MWIASALFHVLFLSGAFDTSFYTIDLVNARLTWKKATGTDSVDIFYRVFPYRLNAVARRFTYDSVMNNFRGRATSF